jgi:GTPase Era involved in 16S rRNA processing
MVDTFENRQGVLQSNSDEAALYRLAELAADFDAQHIASSARTVAERVSAGLFYVAVVGQFKRGKSTLLNALIGEAVLPTGVAPVTSVPSIIRHGTSVAARVRFENSDWADIPIHAIGDYVSEQQNPENVRRVAGLEIFVPSPLLESGMCLVDTPGLGSVFAGNTEATRAFVPHVDAAIVVIGADPPLSGEELHLVETVAEHVDDLLFVLNKADRSSESERTEAKEFARKILAKRLKRDVPAVFEVSALERSEGRGPSRDWGSFVQALQELVLRSGSALVREARERAIRRTAGQLLAVIREERQALLRPLEESENRLAKLRATLKQAEAATQDLEVLLAAEQQRLSEIFVERRNAFLKQAQVNARKSLSESLRLSARGRNGPAYRRELNHLAQDIARTQLTPWLEGEARFADEAFRKTAQRFVELGNDFLNRLGDARIPGLENLPEELSSDRGLRSRSQFHFHVIERVAAPASPLLFVSDVVVGALGIRGGMVRDAQEFLDQLLEVNSSRVQSDVDERVRESRKELEAELTGLLGQASDIAELSLSRARAAQAEGAPVVEAALARLNSAEDEVRRIAQA